MGIHAMYRQQEQPVHAIFGERLNEKVEEKVGFQVGTGKC